MFEQEPLVLDAEAVQFGVEGGAGSATGVGPAPLGVEDLLPGADPVLADAEWRAASAYE